MMDSSSTARGGSADNNLEISAISGKVVKTQMKSKFIVCGKDSDAFDFRNPNIKFVSGGAWNEREIVVLQAMIIGNGLFLCEVIDKRDFENER